MKEYFSLQYKMTSRKLSELGIHPVAGYLLGIIGFVLVSEYLFLKTGFARYMMILIALSLLVKMSERSRTEFLLTVFGNPKSRKIRIVENVAISLPFVGSLLFHHAYLESVCLVIGSVILGNFSLRTTFNFTLPTPFYKKPFEFAVGFRKTIYIFPLAYGLTFVAISVQNLNLGIFSMLLIFLVSFTYYIQPEHEYFVWSYSVSSSRFLMEKLMTASKYAILSVLPIAGTLCSFHPSKTGFILLFMCIGLFLLWIFVLAKYSVYPSEINLTEIILILVSILFPPFILFLIPYFYVKSIKTLNAILK